MQKRKLRLYNGNALGFVKKEDAVRAPTGDVGTVYVAAYSIDDMLALASEYLGRPATTSKHYIRGYFNQGCWGRPMDGITPERGIWYQPNYRTPVRRLI